MYYHPAFYPARFLLMTDGKEKRHDAAFYWWLSYIHSFVMGNGQEKVLVYEKKEC